MLRNAIIAKKKRYMVTNTTTLYRIAYKVSLLSDHGCITRS